MTAKKPVIWFHGFARDDPDWGFIPELEERFRNHFDIVTYKDLKERPELGSTVAGALIIGPRLSLFHEQFSQMPHIKVLANYAVGVDRLNIASLAAQGIKVSNTPHVLSDCVADLAFTLLCASARNIYRGARLAMGESPPVFDGNDVGVEVTGATLGIVGMGDIGLAVARRASAFEMDILYHNRSRRSHEDETAVNATYCPSLHNMLPRCDFVVVACPLTDDTRNMFGDAEFHLMKTTATIVNIGRGAVIDHFALARALEKGHIRAAALDVTYPEPLPRDHPLLRLDNVLITPHYGGATFNVRLKMLDMCIDNLKATLVYNQEMPQEVKP